MTLVSWGWLFIGEAKPPAQRLFDLGEQRTPHRIARRIVVPVDKKAADGTFGHLLVSGVAELLEVVFDRADRRQPFALPTAPAECACGFDRLVAHRVQRRRRAGRALHQPRVVAGKRGAECHQCRSGKPGH
jgi:hypothetical protein